MSFNSPIRSCNSGDASATRSIVMLMGPARRSDLPLSLARFNIWKAKDGNIVPLVELNRLFEFARPGGRHRACIRLPALAELPVLHSVEAAIGIALLEPQTLRR